MPERELNPPEYCETCDAELLPSGKCSYCAMERRDEDRLDQMRDK